MTDKKIFIYNNVRRSDKMYILETNDGDSWLYDENELENARKDQWIFFGGKITHIEDDE